MGKWAGLHAMCYSLTNLCCALQGRKAEEQRAQRLSVELGNFRHEAEKRLAEKDEEIEAIRWVNTNCISSVQYVQPMTL